MGLIRKSLFLGTGGLVSPNSKKQRLQMRQLAALQGASPGEIRRAGGRYDFNGFFGQPPASVRRGQAVQPPAVDTEPETTTIRLSCGHTVLITSPRVARWLSIEGDLSYHCPSCDIEAEVIAVGEETLPGPAAAPRTTGRAEPSELSSELERMARLHAAGALTDAEFQAAKARLLER